VLGTEDQYKLNVVEKVVQEAATKAYGPDDAWKITWTLNDGEAQTSYLVMHEEREIRDADNFRVNPLALYEVSEADFLESGMDAAGNLGATRWESAEMLQRYFHKYYWYYESGAAADLLAGWLPARKAPELIELGAAYQGLADAVRTDWGPYLWSDIYQNDDVLIPASRKRAWCLYGKDIGMLVLERGGDMLVLQDHTAP